MQNRDIIEKLKKKGLLVLEQEPMSRHTTFKIGGPAELFIMPRSTAEAAAAMSLLREHDVAFCCIGNGSNLLVADEGISGAVIAFGREMSDISLSGGKIKAAAGATLAQLCRFACDNGLSGLEFAYGIPGSVGGAVFMNAGAYGGEMKDVVTSVSTIVPQTGEIKEFSANEAGFSYRHSAFEDNGAVITSAEFLLKPGDKALIEAKMKETLDKRVSKQPLEWPSAGSAFKRPQNGFAAALIDQCGLKGFCIGGAQVSEKHAGFIINRGGATCRDVLLLLEHVKGEVLRQTGVELSPEIKRFCTRGEQ